MKPRLRSLKIPSRSRRTSICTTNVNRLATELAKQRDRFLTSRRTRQVALSCVTARVTRQALPAARTRQAARQVPGCPPRRGCGDGAASLDRQAGLAACWLLLRLRLPLSAHGTLCEHVHMLASAYAYTCTMHRICHRLKAPHIQTQSQCWVDESHRLTIEVPGCPRRRRTT